MNYSVPASRNGTPLKIGTGSQPVYRPRSTQPRAGAASFLKGSTVGKQLTGSHTPLSPALRVNATTPGHLAAVRPGSPVTGLGATRPVSTLAKRGVGPGGGILAGVRVNTTVKV